MGCMGVGMRKLEKVADVDLGLCPGGCGQTGETMDEGVNGGAVAGVLQTPAGLQLGKEGLDDESFSQQHFVQQGQQVVLHVAAMPVSRWSLKPKNQAHGGATTLGQSSEDPVAADGCIVAEGQLGAVSKVDAGLLATEGIQQQVQGQQQAGQQASHNTTSPATATLCSPYTELGYLYATSLGMAEAISKIWVTIELLPASGKVLSRKHYLLMQAGRLCDLMFLDSHANADPTGVPI